MQRLRTLKYIAGCHGGQGFLACLIANTWVCKAVAKIF